MWDAADLADLIDPDLPGYALGNVVGQDPVPGLFRNAAAEAFGVGGTDPMFLCVQTSAPNRGQQIEILGTTYKVTRRDPTGSGLVRLQLEQQ
jgi:hypothetical protein